jgi:hypothetical protein
VKFDTQAPEVARLIAHVGMILIRVIEKMWNIIRNVGLLK